MQMVKIYLAEKVNVPYKTLQLGVSKEDKVKFVYSFLFLSGKVGMGILSIIPFKE